jgi:hypothetical protein
MDVYWERGRPARFEERPRWSRSQGSGVAWMEPFDFAQDRLRAIQDSVFPQILLCLH